MNAKFPVKRDNAKTLESRLTSNAYDKIIPKRYLSKGEEPEDLFPRVAKNVALAEASHAEETIYVIPHDIKPNHPRRGELAAEVFGVNTDSEIPKDLDEAIPHLDKKEVKLTEENVPSFAWDTVYPKASEELQVHMDKVRQKFEQEMSHLGFIPNSPTLMNAGDELQQLSACFVDSPADDIEDIHQTAKEAAEIFQSGGGMGYAFWKLRPYGDDVGSTDGIASGPITFMETFDQMCETIAQGGARRGAQMGIMRISHPDIIEFIHSKNKDVSLAHSLRLNDPDDFTHNSFADALEEAREILSEYKDEDGNQQVPKMFRNAVEGHLSNFNISVGVTNDFMEALENNEEFTFTNPRTEEPHISTKETVQLYERYGLGEYVKEGEVLSIPAIEIWDRIIDGSHENGEPGVVFLERINDQHSFDVDKHPDHQILATNPCGEQPLEEYEACNLGHINLSTIVSDNIDTQNGEYQDFRNFHDDYNNVTPEIVDQFLSQAIDWGILDRRIELGTRFLENVVTMSDFPVDKIEKKVREMRKIGLGIMGLAQLYTQLGIPYGSEASHEVARQLMKYINHESKKVSRELAGERGVFEEWEDSKYANPTEYPEWFEHHTGEDPKDWEEGFPIRNHNTTTIAPTGTTSMIGNTSGGCEPIYNVASFKNVSQDVQGDDMLVMWDDFFLRVLEYNGIDKEEVKEEAKRQMNNNEFDGINGLSTVPNELMEVFVTTSDLSGIEHAAIQCACQEGVDSAISKTCNLPNSATKQDMKDVYQYIWDNGGKGVTVYRDGTRSKQVMTTRRDNKEFGDASNDVLLEEVESRAKEDEEFVDSISDLVKTDEDLPWYENGHYAERRKRPGVLYGVTPRVKTGYGHIYVTVNVDEDGRPFEVFNITGDSGGFTNSFVEALAKTISNALRSGVDPEVIANDLIGIRAPEVGFDGEYGQVQSLPDAVGKALKRVAIGEIPVPNHPEQFETSPPPAVSNVTKIQDGGSKEIPKESVKLNPEEDCWCDSPSDQMIVINEGCKKCQACGWSKC